MKQVQIVCIGHKTQTIDEIVHFLIAIIPLKHRLSFIQHFSKCITRYILAFSGKYLAYGCQILHDVSAVRIDLRPIVGDILLLIQNLLHIVVLAVVLLLEFVYVFADSRVEQLSSVVVENPLLYLSGLFLSLLVQEGQVSESTSI